MASRIRTRGDLCGLTRKPESSYGVPTDDSKTSLGWIRNLSDGDTVNTGETPGPCGSRMSGGVFAVSRQARPSVTVQAPAGHDIIRTWLGMAYDGSTTDALTSPSYQSLMAKVGPGEWHLWTGAKVDTLTVDASGYGEAVEVSADIVARVHAISTSYADSKATFTADGADYSLTPADVPSDAPPVTSTATWTVDGTAVPYQTSWSLKIANNLEPSLGVGADGVGLEAGQGSTPQECEVTLDITVTSSGPEWDIERLALGTHELVLTGLDGLTVTLTGCTLGGSGPSRVWSGAYTETLSWTATGMTVA